MKNLNYNFIIGRHNGKSNYELEKILDHYGININCMGCLLSSHNLGIETDCENCDYYLKMVSDDKKVGLLNEEEEND